MMKFVITTPFPIKPNEPLEIELPVDLEEDNPRLQAVMALGLTVWTRREYDEAAERLKDIMPFQEPIPIDQAREAHFRRSASALDELAQK